MATPLYLLADLILRDAQGASLRDWVLERRRRVHQVTWAELADRLARATDGQVVATTVTLRSWFVAGLVRARAEDELDAGAAGG
ncbi:hypothetical protein, partial [Occultella aeris]|uniref:hypothetical protein n=1 Tax=Occultella aeris TaxID=2761496 RepID=UPI0012EA52DC